MAWITDDELKALVASRLGLRTPDDLPQHWVNADAVIAQANDAAYRKLRGILLGRGFTAAQADAWDDRTTWNKSLGVRWAFWEAAAPPDRSALWAEIRELLELFEKETIVISDVATYPTGSTSRIGYGEFDTTDDTFTTETEL